MDKDNKESTLIKVNKQKTLLSRGNFIKTSLFGLLSLLFTSCSKNNIQFSTETPTREKILSVTKQLSQTSTITSSATIMAPKTIIQRINDRSFPSIFMAWALSDLPSEDTITNLAKHDLIITHEWQFELWWEGQYAGEGNSFVPSRLIIGREILDKIRKINPNIIILAEVRYRDAYHDWLPEDSSWWKRDAKGERIRGWENYYMLDWSDPTFRKHAAQQAKAYVNSGIFDGVMLDWWDDDPDRISLLTEIRKQIGSEKLIIVNSNQRKVQESAPYINGIYMESGFWANQNITGGAPLSKWDWQEISNTLLWAENNLLQPRINAVETWYVKSRSELNRMRATTTLALTHSNGYALFSNSNHNHDWYKFWDYKCLGKSISPMLTRNDGSIQRDFSGGIVIYNPMGNGSITVEFSDIHFSAATEQTGKIFTLNEMDGDLYLLTENIYKCK